MKLLLDTGAEVDGKSKCSSENRYPITRHIMGSPECNNVIFFLPIHQALDGADVLVAGRALPDIEVAAWAGRGPGGRGGGVEGRGHRPPHGDAPHVGGRLGVHADDGAPPLLRGVALLLHPGPQRRLGRSRTGVQLVFLRYGMKTKGKEMAKARRQIIFGIHPDYRTILLTRSNWLKE